MQDIPIIDAHHHFWDVGANYHPWLRDEPMIPFRYGDYSALRENFLPEDYACASSAHSVAATVTMEGEWDERDLVAESRWMTNLAAGSSNRPLAHIAKAILHRDDVTSVLAGHAAFPIVRGIRHKPQVASAPDRIERGVPGSLGDPNWRRGYAMLRDHGFHFELQAPWWHADELLDLVAAHAETPVVINHAFLPADRSPEALAGWRRALRRAASAPQISIKISGIGLRGRPWSLEDNHGVISDVIDVFGPNRCMFASNFPVDGLTGSFDTIVGGYKAAAASLSLADRRKLFHDNAIRVYRLPLMPLG